jgi:hypothetical protein
MRKMTRARSLLISAFCLLPFALSLSGCGYALAGRGSFLPDYIKVIGVPQFENRSTVFNLDQKITEQVRQELQGRGRYRVLPEASGDAIITGVITNLSLTPTGFNASQQATRYSVLVTANVQFRDTHTNKVLWENPALQFREEYPVSSSNTTTDTNAFFRQDATALTRLAQNFAKSVVTSILENF